MVQRFNRNSINVSAPRSTILRITEEGRSISGRIEYIPPIKRDIIREIMLIPKTGYSFSAYVRAHAAIRYAMIWNL